MKTAAQLVDYIESNVTPDKPVEYLILDADGKIICMSMKGDALGMRALQQSIANKNTFPLTNMKTGHRFNE